MKKKLIFLTIILLCFININILYASGTRIVTGLDGEKIEVPSEAKRIACYYRPAYEKILMLGKASRIVLIPHEASLWAYRFYPELKGLPTHTFSSDPDIERLLKLKVDLLFYPRGHINIKKVTDAGIAAVCPFTDSINPSSIDEFTSVFKKEVMFFGEVLEPDARVRAEKYCRYLDGIVAKIKVITANIPESEKPKIYYGKSTDLFSTVGNYSGMRWYTELAGGKYLPKDIQKYAAKINMEQIISWDPDIVLLGMSGLSDTVSSNSAYKSFKAFKSGRVYRIPAGIFYWDMSGSENALLPIYLGKKLHPALFKDWDMIKEMKKFYSEIYQISIKDSDAERILNGLPPL